MIRGTSSGADDVIGNGKCVLSGHLREAIWMIASNKKTDISKPQSPATAKTLSVLMIQKPS